MDGEDLRCECPTGFDEPFCSKPDTSNFYCDLNACKNGGICLHTDLDQFYGMKCLCQTGFTGIFCENLLVQSNLLTSDDYTEIPILCQNINNKTEIKKNPIRYVNTSHSLNSYYLIQGDLIWHISSEEEDNIYKNQWPKRLTDIFPSIEENLDAIIFDSLNNEYLIFKVSSLKKRGKLRFNLFKIKKF